jgi:outer membrane protein OmpA-like peptidoglycan-associated protein
MAESVKRYLTGTFGIAESRIVSIGRTRPEIPSFQPGGTREVDLVKAEDRRVDITSETIDLLLPVQIISLQEDPLDADVILTVPNAPDMLASWSVEVIDGKGISRNFGPFRETQERIPGNTILGDASQGEYRIRLIALAKDGGRVTKEERIRLARAEGPEEQMGLRFSILFEFDQSKTVATYEKFLRETVVPTITDGAAVIIHGHTDVVGEEGHNLELSRNRATETMNVIQRELGRLGKRRVKFDTFGFGEDIRRAPFENRLPEERFYNRTVIIDIVPE